ncbi:MAG: histone deacetylase [Pirellulales bacterium]
MTLLYYDPLFLEHDTGEHPERAERLRQVMRQLDRTGLRTRCVQPQWPSISRDALLRVHEAHYLDALRQAADDGGGRIEEDTVLSARSFDAARRASGAVCNAVARVISGEDANAFCAVRPPGHHALADGSMGFCLLNHIAVAAASAVEDHRLNRVLIVDWDVHHGNGAQDFCWNDPQIGYLSIHRWPFYPGTGRASETGGAVAQGGICNLPTEYGTPRRVALDRFRSTLEEFARRIRPELVLISAGFDAHALDPIGSLDWEIEDFVELTQMVRAVADEYAGGRIVSMLEGGYNPGVLAGCVAAHLEALLE